MHRTINNLAFNSDLEYINNFCKILLSKYSGVCYNERILQQTVFINKIRMLQQMQRNITGQCSTCVCMKCQTFPLWLEQQSSSLLSFVRFSYQCSSVICLFVPCIRLIFFYFVLYFSYL